MTFQSPTELEATSPLAQNAERYPIQDPTGTISFLMPLVVSESSTTTPTVSPTSSPTPTSTPTPTASATPTATPDYGWSTPVAVSDYTGQNGGAGVSRNPAVFDSLGDFHVVYEEYHANNGSGGDDEVFWAVNQRGIGWQPPVAVSDVLSGESSERPTLALDEDDTLYAVWRKIVWNVGIEAQLSVRLAGGSWSLPSGMTTQTGEDVLANNQGGDGGISPRLFAHYPGTLDLIWRGMDAGDPTQNIFWSRYYAGADWWTDPLNVSNHDSTLAGWMLSPPAIALDPQGNLHSIWITQQETWYSTSPSTAISWTVPITLPVTSGDYKTPALVIDVNGYMHLIVLRRDSGQNWYPGTVIVSGEYIGSTAGRSAIAVDQSNTIHVVWISQGEIRYIYKPNGQAWGNPQTIFSSTVLNSYPRDLSLLIDQDDELHLVWDQEAPRNQVWHATTNPLYK
jgi:hypothetical protein